MLKTKILAGDLKPGEIINESSLVKEFNISRTPLRQAILLLQNERIIERIPNQSPYVKKFSQREIKALYETLLMVEKNVAFLATHRIEKKQIDQLKNVVEDQIEVTKKISLETDLEKLKTLCWSYEELNIKYHHILSEATQNKFLVDIAKLTRNQAQMFNNLTFQMALKNKKQLRKEYFDTLNGQHQEMLDLIELRNGSDVADSMVHHVKYFYSRLISDIFEIDTV